MFTQATRAFGIWKPEHPSHGRHTGSPTFALVVALGMCAFVCWLVFFLALKIRGEFFVLENNGLSLATARRGDPLLFEGRQAALRFGVRKPRAGEGLEILFESGELFRFPAESERVRALLDARVKEMELTGLLTLIASPAISRLQIWPEGDLPRAEMARLMRFLTAAGFDDFDLALEVE